MGGGFARGVLIAAAIAALAVAVCAAQAIASSGPGGPGAGSRPSTASGSTGPAVVGAAQAATSTPRNGGRWTWQHPNPDGSTLFGISCPSALVCYSAGDGGEVRITTDGGTTWNSVNSGAGTTLTSIACPTTGECVAVGLFATFVRTTDGGATWQVGSFGQSAPLQGGFLLGVTCVDPSNCVAVGQHGAVFRSGDGGATWSTVTQTTGPGFVGVACIGPLTCFVTGPAGVYSVGGFQLINTGSTALDGVACATGIVFGNTQIKCVAVGTSGYWQVFFVDGNGAIQSGGSSGNTRSGAELTSVACVNLNQCYAAGVDGAVYPLTTTTDLTSGNLVAKVGPQSTGESGALFGISCPQPAVCFSSGDGGFIAKTTNGSTGWTQQSPGYLQGYSGISCPSTSECFAAGGTVVRSTDGGGSWLPLSASEVEYRPGFAGISCPTTTTCFAPNHNNVARTDDAGATWTAGPAPTPFNPTSLTLDPMTAISCPSASVCFAVGQWQNQTAPGIIATTDGGASWHQQSAPGDGFSVNSISCPSTTVCFIARFQSTVLVTVDGGQNWAPVSAPNLQAISCPTTTTCFGVGTKILATTDGGTTWTDETPLGFNNTLHTVACASATFCIAGGEGGVIVGTADGKTWSQQHSSIEPETFYGSSCPSASVCYAGDSQATIWATTNGGGSWTVLVDPGTSLDLSAASCPGPTLCFAFSRAVTVFFATRDGKNWFRELNPQVVGMLTMTCPTTAVCMAMGSSEVYTLDGGAHWTLAGGWVNPYVAISCAPGTTTCYAVDGVGTYIKTTDGFTWTKPANVSGATGFTAIGCPDANTCYATDIGAVPKVFKTIDGGTTWSLNFDFASDPNAGLTGSFNALSCPDASTCYAAGKGGTVGITTNGGQTWFTTGAPISTDLTGVSCPSAGTCYFSTAASTITRTADYGATFEMEFGNGSGDLEAVSCASTTSCYAVGLGGLIASTSNGGAAWSRQQPLGSTTGLRGIACPDSNHCYAPASDGVNPNGIMSTTDGGNTWALHTLSKTDAPEAVSCPGVTQCWAVGWPGAIYQTIDGANWAYQTSPVSGQDQTLLAVSCPTGSTCYAVGTQGTILATTDAGAHWSAEVSGTQHNLFGLSCPTASQCVAVGDSGVVLSRSGGRWQSNASGTTNVLGAVSCPNTATCYAVGQNGTVLYSTDLGVTWTAQTSGTTQYLFAIQCSYSGSVGVCLAGGREGTLIFTGDGATWANDPSPTLNPIRGVALFGIGQAWIVGPGGMVFNNADAFFLPCGKPRVSMSPASPGATGSTVFITAFPFDCAHPEYRYSVQNPGGSWHVVQDWTASNTFAWQSPATGVAGAYGIQVDVREAGETAPDASTVTSYQLIACTGASLSASPASPQFAGTPVTVTASSTCPGPPEYRFWVGQNGSWTIFQDYSSSNAFQWQTSALSAGTYGLEVDVRNQGSTASYEAVATTSYVLTIIPCHLTNFQVTPPSPGTTGVAVTLTAAATKPPSAGTNCPNPRFRFWMQGPGGSWTVVQGYSSATSVTLPVTATGLPGPYQFEVDVRDAASSNSYDQYMVMKWQSVGCTSVSLAANPQSPQNPGRTVTLTGSGTCPSTASPPNNVYRFWVRAPGGQWAVVQDYSTSAVYNWPTGGLASGSYGLEVDVKDAGSPNDYEASANITFVLAMVPCSAPSLSASPSTSAGTGSTVTLSASTSACANPRYRFWVGQNGIWKVLQDFSATSTASWNTAAYAAGAYRFEVDVRDAQETTGYDAVANLSYQLNGCGQAGISASPPSPQTPGPTVIINGAATCPGTAQFRFWLRAPGAQWTIKQDYGSQNTFSWATSATALGTYGFEVDVRNAGSNVAYETVANMTFVLAVLPCNKPTLSANKLSPQATGATIILSASTSGCGNPQFRFWVQKPGAFWSIVQDYSTVSTFSWQSPWTGSVGGYGLEVDVRDAAESVGYDAVANLTYQLNGCTTAGVTASSPAVHGTAVTLTATSTCPGTPTYRFWVKAPGAPFYSVVQDWTTTSTDSWTPPTAGTYYIEVDVRDQGGTDSYERYVQITVAVT